MSFERTQNIALLKGLRAAKPLLQVVTGPRQVGKTTAALQVAKTLGWPVVFESADSALPQPPEWIENQWLRARHLQPKQKTLLVLDEIQKIPGWSEVIKRLWDEEMRTEGNVRVLFAGLLGFADAKRIV